MILQGLEDLIVLDGSYEFSKSEKVTPIFLFLP